MVGVMVVCVVGCVIRIFSLFFGDFELVFLFFERILIVISFVLGIMLVLIFVFKKFLIKRRI